ncbi:hydrogenase expression/formation protein HypD [Anaerotaenia torta]|uniref:hydrogenase formation protein HypD n=1 Tax=Anaerotaenia torta TaxID=433293 RepID=UPI003D1E53EB
MVTLEQMLHALKEYDGEPIRIMEVCGTHTSSIFKHGIRSLLSPKLELISGPGCPVCVTSALYIDKLVEYSFMENHCVLTFADMLKVRGSRRSLNEAKAEGGKVRMLYSPLSALKLAQEEPGIQFILAAVGFETTTPIYGLIMDEMIKNDIVNLKLLTSMKTVLPALTYICENEKGIDAFLCPGHVSVITGSHIYEPLVKKYKKPFAISGFEGEHILAAVYEIVNQLRTQSYHTKNLYPSVVREEGNQRAAVLVKKYFEAVDDDWREIGVIPSSGLRLRAEYGKYDAGSALPVEAGDSPKGCRCRDVILGRIHPVDCPLFSVVCSPMNAVGPCMVSTEGACGIWYKNR